MTLVLIIPSEIWCQYVKLMLSDLSTISIIIQLPVVIGIIILSLQAVNIKIGKEFKYISRAWIINLIYLVYSLIFISILPGNTKSKLIISTLFDLGSMYFFFLASFHYSKRRIFLRLRKWPIVIFPIIFAMTGISRIFPAFFEHEISSIINIWNIPTACINTITLFYIADFYRKRTNKYPPAKILFTGALFYSMIQVIDVLNPEIVLGFSKYTTMENSGFFSGLIAKLLMLIGLCVLLINIIKDLSMVDKELELEKAFAEKLNLIIGRTFHEITPPLLEIETITSQLSPEDDKKNTDIPIGRKAAREIIRIESALHRMRTILTASLKMYNSDVTRLNRKSQNIELPIPIDEETDILNINTLIEVAIHNFKSTLIRNNFVTDKIKFFPQYGGNCNILCNSVQIVQVFFNLFKNSFEANEGSKNVCYIFIKTKHVLKREEGNVTSKAVVVEIEDNGPGIPDSDFLKIYEQGYTTKKVEGRGRGYGMAIIKSYTESNGGKIHLESPPENPYFTMRSEGQGTKFILTFRKL